MSIYPYNSSITNFVIYVFHPFGHIEPISQFSSQHALKTAYRFDFDSSVCFMNDRMAQYRTLDCMSTAYRDNFIVCRPLSGDAKHCRFRYHSSTWNVRRAWDIVWEIPKQTTMNAYFHHKYNAFTELNRFVGAHCKRIGCGMQIITDSYQSILIEFSSTCPHIGFTALFHTIFRFNIWYAIAWP